MPSTKTKRMACSCIKLIGNTGLASCLKDPKRIAGGFFVPTYNSSGALNQINLASDTLNQTYFDAKISAANALDRWYPLPELKEVVPVRAESNFKTLSDNSTIRVSDGKFSFSAQMFGSAPKFTSKLKSGQCTDMSIYLFDIDGQLIVDDSTTGFATPFQIDKNTLDAIYVWAQALEPSYINLSFQFDDLLKDEHIAVIPSSDISVKLSSLKGLVDVNNTSTSVTSTTITVSYSQDNGQAGGSPFTGLLVGDFEVKNTTASSTIVPSGVVENPEGTYALTIASQTTGDVGTVTATSTGYEFPVSAITYA